MAYAEQTSRLALSPVGPVVSAAADESMVGHWLRYFRTQLPSGATVTATIQARGEQGYLVAFRVALGPLLFSSEARGRKVIDAIDAAGQGLWRHLGDSGSVWESGASQAG